MRGPEEEDRERNLAVGALLILLISAGSWYLIYLGVEAVIQIVTGGK